MPVVYQVAVKDIATPAIEKVGTKLNELNASFKKVDSIAEKFSNTLLKKVTISNLTAKAISTASSAFISLSKEMIDSYDSAAKLSQNIGITAESVIGLRHAAELSNVGAEAMDKNMEKLSKTMFEAASGNKSAEESFKRLGISVTNSDGSLKKSDKVLMEMADKFKALPPGAERAAAAMNIFGKSGASMVTMLKDGSGALKEMVDEGSAAAGNITGISEAMEKLKDASTKAKSAMMGMLAGLVESDAFQIAVDGFESISQAIMKWRKESKEGAEAKQKENLDKLTEATKKYEEQLQKVANLRSKMTDDEIAELEKPAISLKARFKKAQSELTKVQSYSIGLEQQALDLQMKLTEAKVDDLVVQEKILDGMKQANDNMKESGSSKEDRAALKQKIAEQQEYVNHIKAERKAKEDAANEEAKANLNFEKKKKAEEEAAKAIEAARQKAAQAYEAEGKRLNDWLDTYQKSKRTESEIAEDNYKKEIENFDSLLARKKISQTDYQVYSIAAEGDYQAKLKEIADKQTDERLKKEEATQGKVWDLRKIAARSYGDIAEIEIQQIRVKYEKEVKMAEEAKIDTLLIKQAEAAEIAAIREKIIESEKQQADLLRSYKETAAESDAERMALQMEGITAKYDAELAKAQGNADMIVEIERAKNAEIKRMENELFQMRLNQAEQYLNSSMQVMNAMAVMGKGNGEAQKAIALSQATINTALAATKAATAAPFPLNAVLVAGALAQGATQIATIQAQKFARGGMIPGSNTLIMANEQGREAILNPMAVRAVGGEAGVNALNRGTSNTYDNSQSNTMNINISTSIMTQQAYRNEIEPVLKRAERRR